MTNKAATDIANIINDTAARMGVYLTEGVTPKLGSKDGKHIKLFLAPVLAAAEVTRIELEMALAQLIPSGAMHLCRCDIPGFFDADTVLKSHVRYMGVADYHMVVIEA